MDEAAVGYLTPFVREFSSRGAAENLRFARGFWPGLLVRGLLASLICPLRVCFQRNEEECGGVSVSLLPQLWRHFTV